MTQPLVAPSLLAADFANLQRDLEIINRSEADLLHFDVMDGEFVPNISFGFPLLEAVRRHCRKPLDVHLMIAKPERYVDEFADGGAAIISVHYEASTHLHRTLTRIRERGCQAGVALNMQTPVTVLEDVLDVIDVVLIMTINPGFGGQKLLPLSIPKVRKLRRLLTDAGSPARIEVDGGITVDNAPVLLSAGADVLVAGSSVFGADDPVAAVRRLKDSYQPLLA